jgi:2-C-methyl-D-erythritol 4-phosphate cytidylyltransferase / 2-C-methyl-D-erythritol 2,4-cyclodiphosphate synthase
MRYFAVIPAAGTGRRFGTELPKQYAPLHGRTLIEWALAPFIEDERCKGIVVAIAAGDEYWPRARAFPSKVMSTIGGAERSDSVANGLQALAGRAAADDWVLVHDAARPCLERDDLDRLLDALADHTVGGLLATPLADTLKQTADSGQVGATLDRTGLWRALTPQMFRYARLCAALDAARRAGRVPTDEAQALEWLGERPVVVSGSPGNLKVTTAQDLQTAADWLARKAGSARLRVGSGFDVHAFGPGDAIMLGGVRIPHSHGVVAHSDGDVVLHALCDAMLGAAGLGDIGEHFRDDDPRWSGADSALFVTSVRALLEDRGLAVVNADVTVIGQQPRIAPHREAMRKRLAELLRLRVDAVNVKATTTEGLGFLGRAEGIASQATVLVGGAGIHA